VAVNTSSSYQADVPRLIAAETLEVAQRFCVVHQFADKKSIDKHTGTNWTATRFERLQLPLAPVSEGIPPVSQQLPITQVTGTALQWAGRVEFTDVAVVTIQHDLLKEATTRLGMQLAELRERNGFNALMAGTQVNYSDSKGSRAALVAADTLKPADVNRTYTNLEVLGAPAWSGQTGETVQRSIDYNPRQSEKGPWNTEHYVGVGDPRPLADLASDPTVVQAWSYSDVTRLYINEVGYWRGMHFCKSNLVPTFTGVAAVTATGAGTGGNLAVGTYAVQVTGWDIQNQYESRIYQVQTAVGVTAGQNITLTTPNTPGFTYAVYVSQAGSTAVLNLGTSAQGPTTGPYTGQAISLPPNTAVTINGVGLFQVPPAAPATGVVVYPTFFFGQRSFASLKLEDVSWNRLFEADKSDPHNQRRVIGWKAMEGWVILNQQFLARLETCASNSGAWG
jgi:N4-gp56 family major capsid protein